MYSVIMGRLGEDLVARQLHCLQHPDLASVLGFGVANGAAILLGKTIGVGDMAGAERDAKRLLWLTFAASLLGSAVILGVHPFLASALSLTNQAREYLQLMVWISAVYVVGPTMNTCWICGIFRAGGDSRLRAISELWGVFVPLGLFGSLCVPAAAHGRLLHPQAWTSLRRCPSSITVTARKNGLRNITRDVA